MASDADRWSQSNGFPGRSVVHHETPFTAEDHVAATLAHHDSEHVVVEIQNLRALMAELADVRAQLAEAHSALRDIADRLRCTPGYASSWWDGS